MKTVRTALKAGRSIWILLPPMAAGTVLFFCAAGSGFGYPRYNDGCHTCHGAFTDATSTKGSIFPDDNKHDMHRYNMGTDCDLCHLSGDQKNPFLDDSNGTSDTAGEGCIGCHVGAGLRAHHAANGIATCAACHTNEPTVIAENIAPSYYGSVDTFADNPCNDVLASNTNENWTIGDFVGLDNDGDNLYDLADFDCGPAYEITALTLQGSDVLVAWNTVGGRRDILQSAPSLSEPFSDVGVVLEIPGVGIVTTNAAELGGVTPSNRFYRIRYAP
jgi:hypothetical protein